MKPTKAQLLAESYEWFARTTGGIKSAFVGKDMLMDGAVELRRLDALVQGNQEHICDAIVYGIGITMDGERIDPASIYKQAEQKPVAWVEPDFWDHLIRVNCATAYKLPGSGRQPLYTGPHSATHSADSAESFCKPQAESIGDLYAHRLAFMLECAVLDPIGTWEAAHELLDEYREAVRRDHEAAGEPYVSAFGKD